MLTRRQLLASPIALWQGNRERLNVVLIVVDDLGETDLGCYGSRFYETPNIDRLAAAGMRFTQAYSACTVCSPSRAAILTGKYPARLHLTDWVAGHNYPWARLRPPDWTQHLPLKEHTIAEALKPAGYATASIGKWHLTPPSGDTAAFYPDRQGFDLNAGGTHRGQPPSYFSPYGIETLTDGPPGEYLTDRERLEASRFITANRERPFFVYLPHYTVHTPLQAKQHVIDRYQKKAKDDEPQNNARYAAMIDSLDENVGLLMEAIEKAGVADRTVVILTSDNGALIQSTKTNLGMRAGKGSAYEGGVRVPLIVHWPGAAKPGSTCDVPVIGIDLHPTVLEIAGMKAGRVDGQSLVPLLRSKSGGLGRDAIFWHYPHYHPGGAVPYSAIRQGPWKLIEFQDPEHHELYNLSSDPMEARDLSGKEPAQTARLLRRLREWRREVGAQMAVPNPDYDPKRERERPAPRRSPAASSPQAAVAG